MTYSVSHVRCFEVDGFYLVRIGRVSDIHACLPGDILKDFLMAFVTPAGGGDFCNPD